VDAVFGVSGGGSTARRAIEETLNGSLVGIVNIRGVVASAEDIPAIAMANGFGIPCVVCSPRKKTGEQFADELLAITKQFGANVWLQYGWMPITPAKFIIKFREEGGISLNQHPVTLDPGYPDLGGIGMHSDRALAAAIYYAKKTGVMETEATCHLVEPEVDRGAVVRRLVCPIYPDDDVKSFKKRHILEEHELQMDALQALATGTMETLTRETRFLIPGTKWLLDEAKAVAEILFRNG